MEIGTIISIIGGVILVVCIIIDIIINNFEGATFISSDTSDEDLNNSIANLNTIMNISRHND